MPLVPGASYEIARQAGQAKGQAAVARAEQEQLLKLVPFLANLQAKQQAQNDLQAYREALIGLRADAANDGATTKKEKRLEELVRQAWFQSDRAEKLGNELDQQYNIIADANMALVSTSLVPDDAAKAALNDQIKQAQWKIKNIVANLQTAAQNSSIAWARAVDAGVPVDMLPPPVDLPDVQYRIDAATKYQAPAQAPQQAVQSAKILLQEAAKGNVDRRWAEKEAARMLGQTGNRTEGVLGQAAAGAVDPEQAVSEVSRMLRGPGSLSRAIDWTKEHPWYGLAGLAAAGAGAGLLRGAGLPVGRGVVGVTKSVLGAPGTLGEFLGGLAKARVQQMRGAGLPVTQAAETVADAAAAAEGPRYFDIGPEEIARARGHRPGSVRLGPEEIARAKAPSGKTAWQIGPEEAARAKAPLSRSWTVSPKGAVKEAAKKTAKVGKTVGKALTKTPQEMQAAWRAEEIAKAAARKGIGTLKGESGLAKIGTVSRVGGKLLGPLLAALALRDTLAAPSAEDKAWAGMGILSGLSLPTAIAATPWLMARGASKDPATLQTVQRSLEAGFNPFAPQ